MTKPSFRSKFEEEVWDAVERNGFTMKYETLYLPYYVRGNYRPDFILPNNIIVETKGYFDTRAQVKMKAVKKENPDLDIRVVFMNSRAKVRKGSKMTYGDWCEKHGFPYADFHIPLAWFRERKRKAFE